jgi:hypothetical protein
MVHCFTIIRNSGNKSSIQPLFCSRLFNAFPITPLTNLHHFFNFFICELSFSADRNFRYSNFLFLVGILFFIYAVLIYANLFRMHLVRKIGARMCS